jgi:hypothetical protein
MVRNATRRRRDDSTTGIDRLIDKARAHGIEVNIANQFEQVRICIHERGVLTTLEEMPGGLDLDLHCTRITTHESRYQHGKLLQGVHKLR